MTGVRGSIGALVAALVCASLAGCHGGMEKLNAFLQKPRSPVSATEYYILPPDVLQITSIHVPEINNIRQAVRPDGKINLPLLGEVMAAGRTSGEIEKELVERSKAFYEQQDATVQVTDFKSQKIYVFGQVARPGPIPWTGADTLVDVLAQVQPTSLAWPEKIHVVRGKPPVRGGYLPGKYLKKHPAEAEPVGEPQTKDEKGTDVKAEAPPPPKDKTGKPPDSKGEGEGFEVVQPVTVDIAKAARETEQAALHPDGKGTVMVVNMMKMIRDGKMAQNILLRPDDVVYVPPTPLAAMGLAMQQLLLGIQPAAQTVQVPASAIYTVKSVESIGASKAVP
jgi:polysaccharide export outer membrane protein